MNIISMKQFGLLAQYFIWSIAASSYSGSTHLRLVAFVCGLMIVVTLLGMQLRDILKEISSNQVKSIYIFSLVASVLVGLFIF